jgi:hypothetical protein
MVCHRRGPFGTETRTVEIGDTDDQWVEVKSGLEEGDRVALVDPGAGELAAPAATIKPRLRSFEPAEPAVAPR